MDEGRVFFNLLREIFSLPSSSCFERSLSNAIPRFHGGQRGEWVCLFGRVFARSREIHGAQGHRFQFERGEFLSLSLSLSRRKRPVVQRRRKRGCEVAVIRIDSGWQSNRTRVSTLLPIRAATFRLVSSPPPPALSRHGITTTFRVSPILPPLPPPLVSWFASETRSWFIPDITDLRSGWSWWCWWWWWNWAGVEILLIFEPILRSLEKR